MNETLFTLADIFDRADQLIPIVAIAGGLLVAIVAIVGSFISSTMRASQHERSRREIAAYIAEGTMTPEDGERLLRVGPSGKSSCG